MNQTNQLEFLDDIGIFRPTGCFRFQQVVTMVTGVILQAREQRIRKLVVVGSGLTGFDSPSLSERHWMVRQWVDASNGIVRLAMVVSGDLIDPDKFAVVAAANFGFTAEVFTCERDALKWLRELQ